MLVEPAAFNDHVAICELLHASRLPVPDAGEHPVHMLVVRDGAEIVAVAGWEAHGDCVVIRSVAVKPPARGQGVGRSLMAAALDGLGQAGIREAFVIATEKAARFFAVLGFERVDRAEVPKPVREAQRDAERDLGGSRADPICMRVCL